MSSSGAYLVDAVACSLTKIGRSTRVGHRTNELQASSPVALRLSVFVPDGESLEAYIQRAAADYWSHREWFQSSAPVLVGLRALADENGVVEASVAEQLLEGFETDSSRGFASSFGGLCHWPGAPDIEPTYDVSIGTRSKVVHPRIR